MAMPATLLESASEALGMGRQWYQDCAVQGELRDASRRPARLLASAQLPVARTLVRLAAG